MVINAHDLAVGNLAVRAAMMEKFRHWAIAFIVCNFNVDLGPEIELVYPPEAGLSTVDLTAICFSSFPETHDSEKTEDLTFHFVVPNNSPDVHLTSPCAPFGSPTDFYGYCVFKQISDPAVKRGFNQRSLVLLSNHEFPSFYLSILQQMTTSGMVLDPPTLETAYSEMSTWPPPSVGRLDLPFLGSVLNLHISPHAAFALQGLQGPSKGVTGGIHAYEPIGSWETLMHHLPSLSDLYQIVDRLLLCGSVLVLAKNPQICSQFVAAVADLIKPVPYAGVIRPYLTMQSEYAFLTGSSRVPRNFLIGITNPFLVKRIASMVAPEYPKPYLVNLNDAQEKVPIKRHRSQTKRSFSQQQRHPVLDVSDTDDGSKRHLKMDYEFSGRLETAIQEDGDNAGSMSSKIRRHFAELTAQFLAPLNRYLAASISPSYGPSSDYKHGAARYGNFNKADFLRSLSKYGTAVKFKGQNPVQRHKLRDAFYSGFCESMNFYSWMDMKLGLETEASAGLLSAGPPSKGSTLSDDSSV